MKRKYAAAAGAVVLAVCLAAVFWVMHSRTPAVPVTEKGPVIACADVEHIMMSHPSYSQYHRLELEYNAMVAQYQFEQWHYSQQAASQGQAVKDFSMTDALSSAALDQELQARVAIKQNELNAALEQRYQALLQERRKVQPSLSDEDNLKIVNLRLKLAALALSQSERQAAEQELQALLRKSGGDHQTDTAAAADIASAMASDKEKAQKELQAYALQVKDELTARQQSSRELFTKQMDSLGHRPEPAVWNAAWKEKLEAKEKEMKDQKEAILADIRDKAADVAEEQGIDIIFSEYEGIGTALDVTDDIIVKLA